MNIEEELHYSDEPIEVFEPPDELVAIAICFDLAEAEKLKTFLETEGFQVVVTGCDDSEIDDLAAHIDRGINLNVFSEDGFDATMLLDKFREEQILAGEIEIDNGWGTCPKCAGKNLAIADEVEIEIPLLTYIKSFFTLMRALHCDDCGYEWVTEKD